MKTSKHTIKAAILFYSLVQTGTICISSILAQIVDLYSQYSTTTVQFLATCPNIVIIIVSLLSGKIADFIPKKYLTIFSSTMFVVTALGGFFFHDSLAVLFVWEITLGIGIGILVPMGSILIADYFEGEERSSMLGIQSAAINIGGVTLSLLGGWLATIKWYYNFLAFLLIIPGLILLITGLPLDKPSHAVDDEGRRIKVTPSIVIFYGIISFAFMMLFTAIPTNMSMLLKEHNIMGSVNAGIASAVLMLSGAIAGLLFKKLSGIMRERIILFGFFNIATGTLITAVVRNYWSILIGVFIAGFSLSIVMAQIVSSVAEKENTAAVTMSISMIMAINNLGSFLSPYFTKISRAIVGNDSVAPRYLVVSVLAYLCVLALYTISLNKRRKAKGYQ